MNSFGCLLTTAANNTAATLPHNDVFYSTQTLPFGLLIQNTEWHGVENQVRKLAMNNNATKDNLRVVLISSMGTTYPDPPAFMGGKDLFYKLQVCVRCHCNSQCQRHINASAYPTQYVIPQCVFVLSLQAETFLGSCGLATTVVKPCGS